MSTEHKAGFVTIIGCPNVGKSTLMNALVGERLSIITSKAQTTRHRIMGIHTDGPKQIVFIDTPGLHIEEQRAINRLMNRAAASSLADVSMVIFVVDGMTWTADDEMVLSKLRRGGEERQTILPINKVDNIKDKESLFPYLEEVAKKYFWVFDRSCLCGKNVQRR